MKDSNDQSVIESKSKVRTCHFDVTLHSRLNTTLLFHQVIPRENPRMSKSNGIVRSSSQPAVNATKDSMLQASPMLDKFLQTLDSHPVKGHYGGPRGVDNSSSKTVQKI